MPMLQTRKRENSMANLTGERPSSSANEFNATHNKKEWLEVNAWTGRRLSLAVALSAGNTFLDIGADDQSIHELVKDYATRYVAVDTELSGNVTREDSHTSTIEDYFENNKELFDTTFLLEIIEHVDPAFQDVLLYETWERTRHRMILSTPDPDFMRFYPLTNFFVGRNNPHHTRELYEIQVREMIARLCSDVFQVFSIKANGSGTWDLGWRDPVLDYLIVVERI